LLQTKGKSFINKQQIIVKYTLLFIIVKHGHGYLTRRHWRNICGRSTNLRGATGQTRYLKRQSQGSDQHSLTGRLSQMSRNSKPNSQNAQK